MAEDYSFKNLKSRFEQSSDKHAPPAIPTKTAAIARPASQKPAIKVKPTFPVAGHDPGCKLGQGSFDAKATDSDPFSSPTELHAVPIIVQPISISSNVETSRNQGPDVPGSVDLMDLPQDQNIEQTNLSQEALRVGSLKAPPPPPSPRIKSPRPFRRAFESGTPDIPIARNIFGHDQNDETQDLSVDPDLIAASFDSARDRSVTHDRSLHLPSRKDSASFAQNDPTLSVSSQTNFSGLSSQFSDISTAAAASNTFQPGESGTRTSIELGKSLRPALPQRPSVLHTPTNATPSSDLDLSTTREKPRLPKRVDVSSSAMPPPAILVNNPPGPRLPSRAKTVHQGQSSPTMRRSSVPPNQELDTMSLPSRRSLDVKSHTIQQRSEISANQDSEEDDDLTSAQDTSRSSDQPDASSANRKAPRFKGTHWDLLTGREIRKTALCGDLLVIAHNDKLRIHNLLTDEVVWQIPIGDTRVTAMDFRTVELTDISEAGRYLWVGFKDGSLHEYDTRERVVIERYFHAHSSAVIAILKCGKCMWTLDEIGMLNMWSADQAISLKGRPACTTLRTVLGISAAAVIDGLLWLGSMRTVHVFDPKRSHNQRLTPEKGLEPTRSTGAITCVVHLPHDPESVYFGHDDGKISVYANREIQFREVLSISHYNLSGLLAVGDYLWASFKTGKIFVYDVHARPWRVMKEWHAHKSPIHELAVDSYGLWKEKRLQVSSMAGDGAVKIWDGLLMEDWLENEMQRQVPQFASFASVSALICTWNAGASTPQKLTRDYEDAQFIGDMIREADSPDLIVFGFQELVDLDDKGKAGRSVAKGFFGSSKKKEKEPDERILAAAYQQWQTYLEKQVSIVSVNDEGYKLLEVRHLVGLFTCIFIKRSLQKRVSNVQVSSVKTGLKGRYGNKGGIVIRFTLDDTSLCFVNCHLAAGQKHVMARNNDVFAVLDQAGLPSMDKKDINKNVLVCGGDGSMVLDHEICVLNGDLNYRINGNRSQILQHIKDGRLNKLLETDQLLLELKKNPTHRLRSFMESPISFQPTYKYDPGTDNYDSSEKMRVPAWCDRIYYRGLGPSAIENHAYKSHTCRVSDHRPVSALLTMQVSTLLTLYRIMLTKGQVKTVDLEQRKKVFEKVADMWVDLAHQTIVARKVQVLREITGRGERECRDALKATKGQVVSDALPTLM